MSERPRQIKCLVWDLDNTLWDGILSEDAAVYLYPWVRPLLDQLDGRGILHSVASKNHPEAALERLRQLDVEEYFVFPQIGWHSKVESLRGVARELNMGLEALAFVDDDPVERAEVGFSLPEVLCLDGAEAPELAGRPELTPAVVSPEARERRKMYRAEQRRRGAETSFQGPPEEFLATLGMVLAVAPARPEDLDRAEELTVRTHQLNTTGIAYSREQLDRLRQSPRHRLLLARLEDRFGSYGIIGLTLLECTADLWTIRLFLTSCRVLTRGIGSVLLSLLISQAAHAGVRLAADFAPTERNQVMFVTYRFAGFQEAGQDGGRVRLIHPAPAVRPLPGYLTVRWCPDLA